MTHLFRRISILFAAGAFGGLAGSLALWAAGRYGLSALMKVAIAPALAPSWLYPRLVWGGIWAAIFLIPLYRKSALLRGLSASLVLSAVELFLVYPRQLHKGFMGTDLGILTPVLVVAVNAVWGVAAALWLLGIEEE